MSRNHLLALILSLSALLSAPAALAELNNLIPASAMQEGTMEDVNNADSERRLLREFQAAQLQLTQAIEIAERLHRGSRAAAARFELSDAPAYRVITVSNGEAWENLVDANTGRIAEPETVSPLDRLERDERRNIAALASVAEELSDAVRVAEKAAAGKAFGGGLINDEGKLNFFVVVLSDDELKEVRLEPPKSSEKRSQRYRLR